MKLTMKLSKEDVVNILGEHLSTKGYRVDPNRIEFCFEKEYRGCEVTVFDGIEIECEVWE